MVGVNRIGQDATGLDYSGDSLAIAGDGELLLDMKNDMGAVSVVLDGSALQNYRASFPCQMDADDFTLE